MSFSLSAQRFTSLSFLSLLFVTLTGCSALTNPDADTTPQTAKLGEIKGNVHGGNQPVVGARVYVYATGTGAYAGPGIAASTANASTSLLNADVISNNPSKWGYDGTNFYVTTAADGSFSLGGDYMCTLGTDVYLYATGGNPGSGTNPAAGFLALLGPCPYVNGTLASAVPFVWVNEITTVAAAYAFAGFATDPTHVSNLSASSTSLAAQGMNNAFASSKELVNIATGAALATTTSGNGTAPQALLNSLGNILASCVNSTGAMTSSPATNCYTLFTNTGTGTTLDTASVAINIAQNPGSNVSTIFGLQPSTGAPFQPAASSTPNDFTVGVKFTGGGLNAPQAIAIDGSGNAWVANISGNSISEFNGSTGAAISGTSGYTGGGLSGPAAIAIDGSGNAWVANEFGNSISKFNGSTGAAISGASGYTGGGLSFPERIAIDGSGNAWVANNQGSSISKFNGSTGAAISGTSGYTGGGLSNPVAIAIDGSGNAWVTNYTSISKFNGSTGAAISGTSGYTGGGLNFPYAIAIDGSGNAWVANVYGNSISKFNGSTGAAISGVSGYTGGGLNYPEGVAIDGSGNAWVFNNGANSISEFNGSTGAAISGAGGYTGGFLDYPYSIAIDGSGNVWVVNGTSSVTELIGAGTPVVTPLATGVAHNTLGTRP